LRHLIFGIADGADNHRLFAIQWVRETYTLVVKVWNADAGHLEPASLSLIIFLQHSTLTVNSSQYNTCLPIVSGDHKRTFRTKRRLMDTLEGAFVNIAKH